MIRKLHFFLLFFVFFEKKSAAIPDFCRLNTATQMLTHRLKQADHTKPAEHPVDMEVNLELLRIDFDGSKAEMKIKLIVTWKDPRLAMFNCQRHTRYYLPMSMSERVWIPPIIIDAKRLQDTVWNSFSIDTNGTLELESLVDISKICSSAISYITVTCPIILL